MQNNVHRMVEKTLFGRLGTGVLTWTPEERRSDRYGAIYLIKEGGNSLANGPWPSLIDAAAARHFEYDVGELVAVVKIARKSTHIGDLFHVISPRQPEVGQIIVLGKGQFFTTAAPQGGIGVGLRPIDGRQQQWLNLRSLYDAHEQTVDLSFVPEGP